MILDRSAGENRPVMEEVTDPEELARPRARRERFDRNWEWIKPHGRSTNGDAHGGRCVGAAGDEFLVADRPEEAVALAMAAHPEDDCRFTRFIPRERMARIYAAQGLVVRL